MAETMGDRAQEASRALNVASIEPPPHRTETMMAHQDSWQEIQSIDAAQRDDNNSNVNGNANDDKTTTGDSVMDGSTKGARKERAVEADTTPRDGDDGCAGGSHVDTEPETLAPPASSVETCSTTDEATATLIRAQSSPTLAPDHAMAMPPPLRRTHSGDVSLERSEIEPSEPLPPARDASDSDASSHASHESDGGASVASVAPTPSPSPANTPPVPTAKASSYRAPRRDASLRIFFPTDDLAMRAILSPPTLRSSSSATTTTTTPQQQQSQDAKPSLAESFLETTSRLFFLRGNSTIATATVPTSASAKDATTSDVSTSTAAPPPLPRSSTTSNAFDDDLSRASHTVVAASPNLPPPPFANMFTCENCHDDIGSLLSQGRHHCRNCGGSFCAACSTKTAIVPFQLYLSKGEQRVCDGCYNRIRDFHAQAQTTQITWSGLAPPSSAQLSREFDLAPYETPVTVFNCSYFVDFAPFYGHLFLTREHVCFRGYKTHKIKIAFADLHSLVKPEFYYINALQLNTKSSKEKHFFAEFNGLRDLCFLRTDQLVRAFQAGKKKELTQPLSTEALKQQALGRRRSYKVLAAAAGTSDLANFMAASASLDVDDEEDDESIRNSVAISEDHDEAMSIASSASDESAEPPLAPDAPLSKMAVILDCELRADTQSVFELLWGNAQGRGFLHDHMAHTKDIDIDIEDWQPITSENEAATARGFAISKEDGYTMFRNVRSQHPPKTKFPGLPAYAGCCRTQRLRIEKSSVDGSKWTRFVVSELLRMSGIPFSDYFEIETRWVFTRDGKHYCHVQAGQIVNFLKSTWFKSQIESSSRSESKEGLELWTKHALAALQDHVPGRTVSVARSLPGTPPFRAEEATESATRRRSSGSSERSVKSSSPATATPIVYSPSPASGGRLSLSSLVANPQSLLHVLTLVVLLYCVDVIRHQQLQLQRLSDTTSLLLAKLQQYPSSPSATMTTSRSVCEQKLVDGAAAALEQFFQSQRDRHH